MIHRRRTGTNEPGAISDTAVFITPMLDMSFQLLFFFVIMFQPQGEERRMPLGSVKGDAGGDAPVQNPNPVAAPAVTTTTPTDYKVEVHAGKSGRLNRVIVNVAGAKDTFQIPPPGEGKPYLIDFRLDKQDDWTTLKTEGGTEEDAIRLLITQINKRMRYHKKENDKEDRIEIIGANQLKWKDSVAVMSAVMHYVNDKGESVELYPKVETNLLTPRP